MSLNVTRLSRGSAFAVALLLGACGTAQSLKQQGERVGLRIGAATTPSHYSEADYSATLQNDYDEVSGENAFKMANIHPSAGTDGLGTGGYSFTQADQIVDFAIANGMNTRGHVFIYPAYNPSWVYGSHGNPSDPGYCATSPYTCTSTYSSSQLSTIMKNHIYTVGRRYTSGGTDLSGIPFRRDPKQAR